MERNSRKVLRGTVVSDKMDKTIVVEISTTRSHPLYGRRVKYSQNIKLMMKKTLLRLVMLLKSWKLDH